MALADFVEKKPTLETERLWIRPLVKSDVAALKEWMGDFEKCGYVREGLIRQGKMINFWCDYYIYAMMDTDFALLKK